jgi:hypothetical protein
MTVSNTEERADRVNLNPVIDQFNSDHDGGKLPTQVFSNSDLDEADRVADVLARQRKMDQRARVEFYPKIFLQYFDEYGEPEEEVSWCHDRVHSTDVEYAISEKQHGFDSVDLRK